MKYKKSEAKAYINEKLVGAMDELFPSFTPDDLQLDEKGIRHDVRCEIELGSTSTLIIGDIGVTREELKRTMEIVVDEAKGKLLVSTLIFEPSIKRAVEMCRFAESIDADMMMIGYPGNFRPKTEQEAYEYTKKICDQVDIAIQIYNSPKWLWPSGIFSPKTLAKLADIPNVTSLKNGAFNPVHDAQCFELFGDKIVVGNPLEDWWPVLVDKYGARALGCTQIFHWWQKPDRRPLLEYFELFRKGRRDKGYEVYFSLTPLRQLFMKICKAGFEAGFYYYQHWKYWDGLVGLTGGPVRLPHAKLHDDEKELMKKVLKEQGLLRGDVEYQDQFA